jgi:nucleotide-binding universal stress UspA family protein
MPPVVPQVLYEDLLADAEQQAREYLAAVRQQVQTAAIEVVSPILIGSKVATLLRYEHEARIDLVVMSSHGRSGLTRLTLGSVADQLLCHGRTPLMLVRAAGPPSLLRRIIVPLDGSPLAEVALATVCTLLGPLLEEITVLRVIAEERERPEAERYVSCACQHLQQAALHLIPRVASGDPSRAIIDAAGTDKLVVMATHGRSGAARWVLGSVADQVARHIGAAVLLLRAPAAAPLAMAGGRGSPHALRHEGKAC